ncbi:MAG: DNA methyltransferase [Alphaproteobacteria bacterium]|nr:DNA methyltransferase [Alphaproteobacteria bacterium]
MPFQKYIEDVQKQFKTGIAREHAYRPALKTLIEDIMPDVTAINDPAHIKCGAPDFILHRRKIDVGYIEAKDVGIDLSKTEKTDQLKRYLESLDNLVLTDYLEFRFYRHGEKVDVIRIADIENGQIKPIPENYDRLKTLLLDFSAFQGQTIKSAKQLAKMMAHKAKLMKHIFYNVVSGEEESSLKDQLKAFQNVLMHDMTEEQFADVYAQTIAYGLFTARLHDKTKEDFSRSEALLLIPKSNPFLRQLFSYIAGSELDERVVWIVDALCEVFLFSDLDAILKDFGTATGQNDPMLHFYETFLTEYDKELKELCGVWYTPESVVNFIVRATDEVLKTHFDLKNGIADTSKIKIKTAAQEADKRTKTGRKMYETEVHKVQLLDVATGTGTFLAEAVKQIYRSYKGQEGIWSSYVENDLLPRLHGFELLMASYAMCHMKLDLLLQETGYKPTKMPPRLSVFLTNSLEEHHEDSYLPFANWLSHEANEATRIKRDMPIMVAFGNPPYNGESQNKGDWIMGLMDSYKQEPSGGKLKEKNSKWINNDYAKFIRMGEHFIDKNQEGVLAYITSHSYLDGPIFRGMRYHLLQTFNDIYILDLHGNPQKENAPDGGIDQNVFDIVEGVSIIVAVKHSKKANKKELANLHHAHLWGKRQSKYDFLSNNTLSSIPFEKLDYQEPFYFFVPKDFEGKGGYDKGFVVTELFPVNNTGIITKRDKLCIQPTIENSYETIQDFLNLDEGEVRKKYKIPKDVRDWKYDWAKQDIIDSGADKNKIIPVNYRPFDRQYIYYTGKSKGLVGWPVSKITDHFVNRKNIGLITSRMTKGESFAHAFLAENMIEVIHLSSKTSNNAFIFPLYLYQSDMGQEQKVPNLDQKIYGKIKQSIPNATPESLFDYIYAVLHNPTYRDRYAEFLKIDFPRIPYPDDVSTFNALAKKGAELRGLHLMESDALDDLITTYPEAGDNEVQAIGKNSYRDGKVWINESQYFGKVPETAWEFYIGGYQPAQKWLKDRKGRTLSVDDIMHYQRIIVALTETERIMKEIDEINFLLNNNDK